MDGYGSGEPRAVPSGAGICPGCQKSHVSKFALLALSTAYLDEAQAKRKQIITNGMTEAVGWQNEVGSSSPQIQAENHYLLVLRGHSSSVTGGDTSHQRTGRWTKEEVALTDFLVRMFDDGRLPIEQGVKLSDFLADFLLCKSSRLSKKMKNSQLGTRSYSLRYPATPIDVRTLSQLVDRFLQAIPSEPTRYELQFNITKFWRTRLANLALEFQSNLVDVSQWIAGLEVIEEKGAAAQDRIRIARRRRLGLADPSESNNSNENISSIKTSSNGDLAMDPAALTSNTAISSSPALAPMVHYNHDQGATPVPADSTGDLGNPLLQISDLGHPFSIHELGDEFQIGDLGGTQFHDILAAEEMHQHLEPEPIQAPCAMVNDKNNKRANGKRQRKSIEVDDDALSLHSASQLSTQSGGQSTRYIRSHCGPFLSHIMSYIEKHNMPFQHADVWVPSFDNDPSSNETLKLFHAGYVTRNDLEWTISSNMDHFGESSTNVTFYPGSGLPGRVFNKGTHEWIRHLDTISADIFHRSSLANQHGVKTCFCFPLATSVIGKICVAMYSTEDLEEDHEMVEKCVGDLSRLTPKPKWKLVVEVSGEPVESEDRLSQSADDGDEDEPVERRIATLLGDHMPLSDITSSRTETTEGERKREALLPHFLSLRLAILRPSKRRSTQEKDRIKLVVDSFRGYDTGRRSEEDLAFLIVRDWVYISAS